MNCVLYARVSTDRQAEKDLSIPAQLQAMRDYANQKGWVIVNEFVEAGASARTTTRPALQKLIEFVKQPHSECGVVVVHKIDRLARNVYDHATIKALLKHRGIRLASVIENTDDTISGQLVENIMASIAQFYSGNLAEEVKKGMHQKVLNGGWPHLPPVGYISVREGTASRVQVHPRLGPLVTKMFSLFSTKQYSMKELGKVMYDAGLSSKSGKPISPSRVMRLLSNSFYVGRLKWGNGVFNGAHKPLVEHDLFDRVQKIIRDRSRHNGFKGSVKGVPLRPVAVCALCRGRMTAERHRRWVYYRCNRQNYDRDKCNARFCNAAKAHHDLMRTLDQLRLTKSETAKIRGHVRSLLSDSASTSKPHVAAARSQVQGEQAELTKMFLAGQLSAKDYETRRLQLKKEETDFEAITKARGDAGSVIERVNRILDIATSMRDLYERSNDAGKARLVGLIFDAVVLSADGIAGFTLKQPFASLKHVATKAEPEGALTLLAETAA